MSETQPLVQSQQAVAAEVSSTPEFPNLVSMLADRLGDCPLAHFLHYWESAIFSILVIVLLTLVAYFATRNRKVTPGGLQNVAEFYVTFVDDFICSIMGPRGSKFTPFIGTMFIYILTMNYIGLIPFLKAPTADLSTTLALALIVFFYVQYTAFRELGFLGYFDHLMGKPRGIMAATLIMPVFMLGLHIVSELVRPVSLSLRLRSNIYGDDMILALFASWGLQKGFVWFFFNFILVMLTSAIQAAVFCLLTTIYLSLVMHQEEAHE